MPKQKSHKGAKKRFKITGTGKVLRRRAMRSHYSGPLGMKSPKRKRGFRRLVEVARADLPQVKKMLGGR